MGATAIAALPLGASQAADKPAAADPRLPRLDCWSWAIAILPTA